MTVSSTPDQDVFKLLFSSSRPLEIEAASSILLDNEIESFQINKKDSSYIFGEIELYVKLQDLEKAVQILKENELL